MLHACADGVFVTVLIMALILQSHAHHFLILTME